MEGNKTLSQEIAEYFYRCRYRNPLKKRGPMYRVKYYVLQGDKWMVHCMGFISQPGAKMALDLELEYPDAYKLVSIERM